MNKAVLSSLLRSLGLIRMADSARFYLYQFYNWKINRDFHLSNPHVALPPDYLIYESFQLNYEKYFLGGFETAKWLLALIEPHLALSKITLLDWGCGPGRVIRHLPSLLGPATRIYGTDYNAKSIQWCRKHLQHISFNCNSEKAELPYDNDFFDLIYGISVLTHLSEKGHFLWTKELLRMLKPGGILFLTSQGHKFRSKLTTGEKLLFDSGKLVTRGRTIQGHRTYSAFHPKEFMRHLFKDDFKILEHIVPSEDPEKIPPQDIWILKKL